MRKQITILQWIFSLTIVFLPIFLIARDAPITTAGSSSSCPGGAVTVPVTVTNFTLVGAVSLRIDFNPTQISLVNYSNLNPALAGASINTVTVNPTLTKLLIAWTSTTALTLANGSKLLDLNFTLISGSPTVSFNNTSSGGGDCEYADEHGNVMNDLPTANFYFNSTITNLGVAAASIVSGTTSLCAGSANVGYSVAPINNATGYIWTVPSGGSIVAGTNTSSIVVNYSVNAVSGSITVAGNNTCGTGASSSLPVTIYPLPVPVINGISSLCVGSTGILYSTASGMTNYTWSITGGTITSGSGTAAVTVSWNTVGSQSISVNYSNSNLCRATSPTVKSVVVNPLPTPTITGLSNICVGTTGVTYTTEPGMTSYLWSISAGGTITSGAGTPNITVTWNTVGSQSVSVNYSNANLCRAAAPTVKPVVVNALPIPTITGNNAACVGTTGVTYTTESGMIGYVWNISAGGTITAGSGTSSVTVSWNTVGAQTVSVNYTNSNLCSATAPTTKTVIVNPVPVPTITGISNSCVGTTGVTYSTETGMSGYTWSISAGGTITGGSGTAIVTVTWNTAGSQSISVNYSNSNLCRAASPTVKPLVVNPLPVPTITGISSTCIGTTGVTYTTEPGMTSYLWSVSAGGTITSGAGTDAVTVSWSTAGSQSISVNYTNVNSCRATTPTVKTVAVNPLPVPTITGTGNVCIGTTSLTYTTEPGMTSYLWNVSAGGTITGGSGTAAVSVLWNTVGSQSVSVNYTNSNLCSATMPTFKTVVVNPVPVPTITGNSNSCVGATGVTYSTEPGMTGYSWNISAGGAITAGSGTPNVSVTWNTVGAQSISVNYTNANSCSAANPTIKTVVVNPLPLPTITGVNNICVGTSGVSYTTEPGMTSYLWNVSAGGAITAGAGTNNIMVTWNSTGAQTVSVSYINANGCQAAPAALMNITVDPFPSAAGNITGSSSVCNNSFGVAYSTPVIPNTSVYLWNLPPGATIATGAGTNNITVDFGTSAVSGNITVLGNNICGNGIPSPPFPVTVNLAPAAAGSITGPASICPGAIGVNYSIPAIPYATGYIWTLPAGAIITSGANTNNITVSFGTLPLAGVITVKGSNLCGNGNVSPDFNVTVSILPAPVIAAAGAVLTSNSPTGNQWFYEETGAIPGATGQVYTAVKTGWYWATVSIYDCVSDTSNHVYVLFTGQHESPGTPSIAVFPVPNDGRFTISVANCKGEICFIRIYNQIGAVIYKSSELNASNDLLKTIDLRPIPRGIYTLVLQTGDQKLVRKLIVQ